MDAGNDNYRLLWGSPAIDAGTTAGAPPFDLDGVVRPQDGNFDGNAVTDMGAYERAPLYLYLPRITHSAAADR
ncbi:MAG: choice-of-anchor Q domain-containing protein [Caldilinea sp.]